MALTAVKKLHSLHINSFGPELDQCINQQLAANGLPKFRSSIIFYRTSHRSAGYQYTHIDGNDDTLTHCSVIVPIHGCKNTAVCWFKGNYTPVFRGTHWDVQWASPGILSHVLELVEQPYLCKVDVPHDVYTNKIQPRITCTFRLEGNPKFESFVK